ncbi:MAG: S41 family peptidase [Planctomycetota bacterium]|jgi:hypothetical protein
MNRTTPIIATLLATCIQAQEGKGPSIRYSQVMEAGYKEELSLEERIAGLSKLWAEVKFNFAYFDQTDVDWDALYMEYIPEVIDTENTLEYYRLLAQMCSQLEDGHTGVNPPSALSNQVYARPRFRTALIENKVIVTEIHDEDLEDEAFMLGSEVLSIDGMPVKKYAELRVPFFYLSSSTPQDDDLRRYSYGLLAGSIDKSIEVSYRSPDGEEGKRSFERVMGSPRTELMELEMIDGFAHLTINSFNDPSLQGRIDKVFDKITASEGLIIDLRANGGGNTPTWLLSYLAKKPFKSNLWKTRSYAPALRAWGREEYWRGGGGGEVQPDPNRSYEKPVAVLIGPRTFSAAEDFSSVFDMMDRGPLIGEPTGGSTGQPLRISLPGGGSARICTKRDSYADGTEFVGVGVQPDISIPRSISDVYGDSDPVLERALQYLRTGS